MSGFGLGGFGSGFLQGFEAMGQNFARRGILQAERQNQARADRKMQLEEELDRLREERAAKESASVIRNRDLQSEGLGIKNAVDKQTAPYQVETESLKPGEIKSQIRYRDAVTDRQKADTRLANASFDANVRKAGADADRSAADVQLTTNQAGEIKANGESTRAVQQAQASSLNKSAEQTGVETDIKRFDLGDKQRQENTRVKLSEALPRIKNGTYTLEDLDALPRLSPIINIAKNPTLRQDTAAVIGAVQQAAARKGDVEVFNQPDIMGALNRTFGEQVNVTRGMPLTEDGRYVAKQSELVKMIRHPTENLIGFEVRVQPELSPQRQAEIAEALKTASPQQAQALQAELNPAPYQTALTDQRTPVAQGGKMRWFTPEEVKKAVIGIHGIGQLQANQPELINELIDLQGKNDRGELNRPADGKALDTDIKVRTENRNNREEMRKIEGDSRAVKKEKRAERGEAFKEASAIIDKQYSTVDPMSGAIGFVGDSGQKAADEKLMVGKVLRRNPNMDGAQALEKARGILAKQGNGASVAQSGVKSGSTKSTASPKAEALKSLWR